MERRRGRRSNHNTLYALIYGADGSVSNTEDDDDDEYDSNSSSSSSSNSKDGDGCDDARYSFLIESLRNHFRTAGNPNVWATIGCAFAPPPHHELSLTVIKEATLLRVGTSTLDISLSVPVAARTCDQLLQILVTVGYPQAISFLELELESEEKEDHSELLVATVMQQIQVLEGHATDRLAARRKSSQQQQGKSEAEEEQYSYERLVIEQRVLEELQQEPSAKEIVLFPEWWTTIQVPTFPFPVVKECQQSLKPLLNEEEFEDELRALFVHYYQSDDRTTEQQPQLLVLRSAVASIGASGLYLKARCAIVQSLDHDTNSNNTNKNQNQNSEIRHCLIPYISNPNTRTELSTMNEIQEGVLTLVESVTPLPKPTVPISATESVNTDTTITTTTTTTNDNNNNDDDTPFIPFNEAVMKSVTSVTTTTAATTPASNDASATPKSKHTVVPPLSSSESSDDENNNNDNDDTKEQEEQQEAIVAASFGFADLVATNKYDDDDADDDDDDDTATTKTARSDTSQQSKPSVVPHQQQQPYSSVLVDNNDDNTDEQQKQEAAIIAAIAATDYNDNADSVDDDDHDVVAVATTKENKINGDHVSQSATDDDDDDDDVPRLQQRKITKQQQPKSFEVESKLAAKYISIEDLGERAFVILRDLEMI